MTGNNGRSYRHVKELSRDSGNGGSLKRGGGKHGPGLRSTNVGSSNFSNKPISIGRIKLREEVECEEVSKELLEFLPSSDSIKKHASLFGKFILIKVDFEFNYEIVQKNKKIPFPNIS